jgi:DNA-nicking Smr family endonuclease
MPPNDDLIWTTYAKGVKRLPRRAKQKPVRKRNSQIDIGVAVSAPLPLAPAKTQTPRISKHDFSAPLDHRAEKRLRQGDIELNARIDLHGMTQAEAHTALAAFIAKAVKRKSRKLLVITGRGRGGMGVLRAALPQWLAALPEAGSILALRPASVTHGGDGAFYVLLRKQALKS